MEFVSFQNVNHFVPKQAEKEQKQSADRESFQDIMKKAPEQAQTEKEQEDVSKSEKKDPIVQNGNFVLQSQLLIVQAPVQEAVQQGQENPMTETVPGELSAGTVPENAEWTGSQQVMSGIETAENAGMLIDDASRQEAQRLSEKTEITPETLQTTDNGQTTSKTTVSETSQTENQTGNGVQSGDPFKADRKEELEKSSDLDRLTETQPEEKPEESNVATVGRQDAAEHTSGAARESGKREQIQGSREVLMVSKPEELPQELTRQLLVKASSGRNEFEIQITPKHLGEITVRIAQEDGCSVVSIICSEKKTMELLAQSAKEIGSVMEQNLGKPTEIYVDEQKSETLWQDGQQDQDHSGRESEQYRQKEEQEKMQKAENTRFLQELRLGLIG